MALDPRIALAGIQPQFSLFDLGATMRTGQQLQAGRLALTEEQRQQQEAERIRQAYAQQYGGGAPAGLAGAVAQAPPGAPSPVQEQQLGGGPTAAAPYATAPMGGPQPPQGLGGLAGQMGGGMQGPVTPADREGQRAFINKLYTISPKAGREAEAHAYATQENQLKAGLTRVEYLGRVADGVLESGNPQQAWEVAKAMLLEQGMPPSQLPTVYDPSYVRQLSGMARDAKDKYNEGMLRLQQAKEQRERTESGAKVPDYGLGQESNALMHEMFGAQLPPGSAPTPAMTQRVNAERIRRELEADAAKQQGRVEVAAATGSQAAQARTVSETAQKRLAALDTAGLAAQDTHTSLDEIDRLIGEGVYGNSPVDRTAMLAYRKGLRPNDTKANRTARLQELGNQLILARGSLGSNVSNTDAEIYAKAAGNFQQAKNLQEMQESIKSMRTILNKAIDFANTSRTSYEATGKLPPFEGRPMPESRPGQAPGGAGKRTSRPQIQQKLKQGWTLDQAVDYYRSQGYEVTD